MVCSIEHLTKMAIDDSPAVSLADRIKKLEQENAELRRKMLNCNKQSLYQNIIPEDTLDLALLIAVVALVMLIGKKALN
jgi:hypothetical protein